MTEYPKGRSGYAPGRVRMGDPTPQSDPDLFSVEDLQAEARYLATLNRRHGAHTLRVLARYNLLVEIARRNVAEREAAAARRAMFKSYGWSVTE